MKFKGIDCEKFRENKKIMRNKFRRCSKQNQFEVKEMQVVRKEKKFVL